MAFTLFTGIDAKADWLIIDDSQVGGLGGYANGWWSYPDNVWTKGEVWNLSKEKNHSYTPVYAGRGCHWRYIWGVPLVTFEGRFLIQDVQVHINHPNFKGITNYRINGHYIGAVNQDKAPGGWSVILPAYPGVGGHANIETYLDELNAMDVHMYASYNSSRLLMGADAVSIGYFRLGF